MPRGLLALDVDEDEQELSLHKDVTWGPGRRCQADMKLLVKGRLRNEPDMSGISTWVG